MVNMININHFHCQFTASVQVVTDEHLGVQGRQEEGGGGGSGRGRGEGGEEEEEEEEGKGEEKGKRRRGRGRENGEEV